MKFNQQFFKFLTKVMASSLAVSSMGYIQISAMEKIDAISETKKIDVEDLLNDIMKQANMDNDTKRDFLNAIRVGLWGVCYFRRGDLDGKGKLEFGSYEFYRDLKFTLRRGEWSAPGAQRIPMEPVYFLSDKRLNCIWQYVIDFFDKIPQGTNLYNVCWIVDRKLEEEVPTSTIPFFDQEYLINNNNNIS